MKNSTESVAKKYKLAVVIGRFQIFHKGHKYLIDEALKIADEVLVLIGSSHAARNIKNPFTFDERVQMICDNFDGTEWLRMITAPITDNFYDDDAWALQVANQIEDCAKNQYEYTVQNNDITIVGHKKDKSSYYLNMFPQYDYIEVEKEFYVNATDIREMMYKGQFETVTEMADALRGRVPGKTAMWLRKWITDNYQTEYIRLINEYMFIEHYKRMWERTPYPVIFQTVDAVVVRSNHVLMIKRRAAPGEGLWALPGGFLNYREKTLDAAIRELKEETKLDIPDKILYSHVKNQKRFDHPDRSLRGRTITEAFFIQLPDGKLDKVKGSDDAIKAKWIHLNDLKSEEIYEDHYSIIRYFTGV
ncbi:nicotinamide-nucleotide adenylyltransferase, NadM family / ADP-ribose pyrophosphatase [Synechococcus phage BUCT-ZZ01]|nr:nicotinamide-nucleotide adenylyltransferase, NadM family / ADP-ribose pyrophosphatase [Synechococcus phage BUCT-ZZ01]